MRRKEMDSAFLAIILGLVFIAAVTAIAYKIADKNKEDYSI